MKEILFLFIIIEASVVLIGALGIPMWQRKIKPNRAYGFRTKLTLQNPKIWYEVNATSGRDMFYFMLVMAIVAVTLLFIKTKSAASVFLSVYAGVLIVGMLIVTARGILLARKLYKQGWGETKPRN